MNPMFFIPLYFQFFMTMFFCCLLMMASGKRVTVIDFLMKRKPSSVTYLSVMAPRCWSQGLVSYQQISHLGL